jgi:hypothetical protein
MKRSGIRVIPLFLVVALPSVAGQSANDWRAFYNRGAEELENGEPREAVTQFQKALAIQPDNPKILYGLVVSNFDSGRTSAALDASHHLLRILGGKDGEFALTMAV